jgi:hypothetical protein
MWKNKITAEEIKVKKGDKPPDCKGAILADDVSFCFPNSRDKADE